MKSVKDKRNHNLPLVSIVIDNWNGKHFLKKCFDSLLAQKYPNFEVVIIDDASSDGSAEFIKKNYPKMNLIENKKHVGFAIANNQGIRVAKGKYLLFLNNDTRVSKNFLFSLVEDLEDNPKLGAVQSKIKVMDNPKKLDDVASYLTPIGFLYHLGYGSDDSKEFDRQYETFSPKGACFLIRKDLLDKIGLFDDRFYCYFEESDLAWRIWLAGYRIIFEPKSVIYHFIGGSVRKQTPAKRDYYAIRNRLNSLLTNLSCPFLAVVLPLHFLAILTFLLVYLFTGKWQNFLAVLKALLWNFLQIPNSFKKRRWVQTEIRKVSDSSLFKHIFRMPSLAYYLSFFIKYQRYQRG